eukprot:700984-Pyramimonas_sp.AAC.1
MPPAPQARREPVRGAAGARASADRLVQKLRREVERWKAEAAKVQPPAKRDGCSLNADASPFVTCAMMW